MQNRAGTVGINFTNKTTEFHGGGGEGGSFESIAPSLPAWRSLYLGVLGVKTWELEYLIVCGGA
jgi:hypothetical protein